MSKFWQGRTSWKETVTSTVTGLSDGAARLRQNLAVPNDGRGPPSSEGANAQDAAKSQQFLRLPVESAKKLRWYDRPDLNNLVQQNLREKTDILGVNAALRQVLLAHGISEDDLETELEGKLLEVDRMRTYDEGVNSVLVASAADEIASLRAQIDAQAHQIEQLHSRLKDVDRAQPEQAISPAEDTHLQMSHTATRQAAYTPPSVSQDSQQSFSLAMKQAPKASPEKPAGYPHAPRTAAPASPALGNARVQQAHTSQTSQPGDKVVEGSVSLRLHVAKDSNDVSVELVPVTNAAVRTETSTADLHQDTAASSSASHAASEHDNASAGQSSYAGNAHERQSGEPRHEAPAADVLLPLSTSELQHLLQQEKQKTAALMGKLQRLEEERLMHVEQLGAQDDTLTDMDRHNQALRIQLNSAQAQLTEAAEAAERHVAHLRAQAATASGQQLEALRRAQDICTLAESKATAADRRAQKAEGDLRKATADLRAREREKDAAELRASAAQAEADKGSSASQALSAAKRAADEREAGLQRSIRDAEAKHKEQVSRLDAGLARLQAAVSKSQQEVSSLEQRLLRAEQAEVELSQELREAEAHAHEQEGNLLRAAALEDRLKEFQAEQGQLDNYKQLAQELETAKARVEEEVIATAGIATGLEARLRQARQDALLAQQQAQQAELRATQAEQRVDAEAERRLASIGSDRSQWPAVAREEVTRLETKHQAMAKVLEALQRDMEQETEARQAESQMRVTAQERCAAAEEQASKQEWEYNQAATALQRKVSLLQQQLEDMKQAVTDVEQERDQLKVTKRKLHGFPSFGSLGPNTPKRGSGSIGGLSFDEDDATPSANGHSREHLEGVDIVYLKNVLLKFVDAHAHGRTQECGTLLPAIAAIVRATPVEYRILKDTLERSERTGNWWARAVS